MPSMPKTINLRSPWNSPRARWQAGRIKAAQTTETETIQTAFFRNFLPSCVPRENRYWTGESISTDSIEAQIVGRR